MDVMNTTRHSYQRTRPGRTVRSLALAWQKASPLNAIDEIFLLTLRHLPLSTDFPK